MRSHEEGRRLMAPPNHLKRVSGCGSHNALGATLTAQHSDLSKGKKRTAIMSQLQTNTKSVNGSATINFRQNKHKTNEQTHIKNNNDNTHWRAGKTNSVLQPYNTLQNAPATRNLLMNKQKKTASDLYSERSLSKKKQQPSNTNTKKTLTIEVKTLRQPPEIKLQCEQDIVTRPLRPKTSKKQLLAQPCSKRSTRYRREPQELIKEFNQREELLNKEGSAEVVVQAEKRELWYKIDPCYIQRRQKFMSWKMRAKLMEWMMQVGYEFGLKRETVYIALTLVDLYMQQTKDLSIANFQLVGAGALFLSAKIEQKVPLESQEWSKSTMYRYKALQIRQTQLKICKTLRFCLNPPTMHMWANQIMQQWDSYLEATDILQHSFFIYHQPPYFKQPDQQPYRHFRQTMQLLDCAMLDVQTLQHTPRVLILALLFLVLGRELGEFSKKQITNEFPRTSRFLLDQTPFNQVFQRFINDCFHLEMSELLPSAQYMASFFILPLSFTAPCLRQQHEDTEHLHWEQYSAYQTYNSDYLAAVQKRFRGLY